MAKRHFTNVTKRRLYPNEIAKRVALGLVDPVDYRPFAPSTPWATREECEEEDEEENLPKTPEPHVAAAATPLPFTLVLDKRPSYQAARLTAKRPYHTAVKLTNDQKPVRLPANMSKLHTLGQQSRSSLFAYSLSVSTMNVTWYII